MINKKFLTEIDLITVATLNVFFNCSIVAMYASRVILLCTGEGLMGIRNYNRRLLNRSKYFVRIFCFNGKVIPFTDHQDQGFKETNIGEQELVGFCGMADLFGGSQFVAQVTKHPSPVSGDICLELFKGIGVRRLKYSFSACSCQEFILSLVLAAV